jgi:hypothetical protein
VEVGGVEGGLERAAVAVGGEGRTGDGVDVSALAESASRSSRGSAKALIARSRYPDDGAVIAVTDAIRDPRIVTFTWTGP